MTQGFLERIRRNHVEINDFDEFAVAVKTQLSLDLIDVNFFVR